MKIDTRTFVASLPFHMRYEVDRMFRQILEQRDDAGEPLAVEIVVYSPSAGRGAPSEGLSADEERRIEMALGMTRATSPRPRPEAMREGDYWLRWDTTPEGQEPQYAEIHLTSMVLRERGLRLCTDDTGLLVTTINDVAPGAFRAPGAFS